MTLQQIFYALTVAEIKSMNKAAEKLFISQPSLTNAIKELEKETGIMIFRRTNRGVINTNAGEECLMYARQVYQHMSFLRANTAIKEISNENSAFPHSIILLRSKRLLKR